MKKWLRVLLGVAAIALIAGLGVYTFLADGRSDTPQGGLTFQVEYVWDGGIKELRIKNLHTGAEETDRKWRARVSSEAESFLLSLTQTAGLPKAVGRFHIGFHGYDAPYLPQVFAWTSDPELIKDPDFTPLMRATYDGDNGRLRRLIANGADVNASDQHGLTALMYAAGGGNANAVRALLAAGAEVNVKDRDGEAALSRAAGKADVETVSELIRHGADVNVTSKLGITPLMEAARRSLAVVRLLAAKGADVNAKDVRGDTALMRAVWAERADIVGELIKAGADVNARDNGGDTALSVAQRRGYAKIVQMLKRAGASD